MAIKDSALEEARRRKRYFQQALLEWAKSNLREFPWRKNRTPYRVLVAEVILRRTTSKAASRVYEEFLKRWPDVRSLASADIRELEEFLKAIGYHKQRAKILKSMANFIVSEYGGRIPNDIKLLLRIPHVGFYIAGAILSLGYGTPAPMVDSNVQRILTRVFKRHLPEKPPLRLLLSLARELLPEDRHEIFNLALLDLGALICRYDRPRCEKCPLAPLCDTAITIRLAS